jgi:excisionase family DNA binding protein
MMAIKLGSRPPLLTARQVAQRLNVSTSWVLEHARGKRKPVLPSVKMGKAVRFVPSDVDGFVEYCRRQMSAGRPIQ